MGTIQEKLTYLEGTKSSIKQALVNKGVEVSDSDTFRSYADKINNMSTGSDGPTVGSLLNKTISEYIDINNEVSILYPSAFSNCDSLITVSFPICTNVGSYAFQSCNVLTNISFPVCTNIGGSAFGTCFSLISAIFPVCTSIGYGAFQNCNALTNISFPVCTNIGGNAFRLTALTSINFPSCTSIGTSTFYNCYNLTTALFPACTSIGNYAFNGCHDLVDISFPACTNIGSLAFAYCSSLTDIYFPACTSISNSAFHRCVSLSRITFGNSIPTLINPNAFYSTPISMSSYLGYYGSIYVPSSMVSAYQSATNWATYADRITAIVE